MAATAADIYTSHADGFSAKVAAMLASTESNYGADASCLLLDNAHTAGSSPQFGNHRGNWPSLTQNLGVGVRSRAPYLSPNDYVHLGWGVNDIGAFGPVGAAFLTMWNTALFAVCCYARLGHIVTPVNSGIPSGWAYTAMTTGNAGTGVWTASGATPSISFTIPSDYDGQAIVLFPMSYKTLTGSATATVTIGGVTVATGSLITYANAVSGAVMPFAIRLPNSIPQVVAGATVTVTFSATGGSNVYYWGGWGIEANPAPLVNISDTLRAPAYTPLYTGAPYVPTDADVTALNAANVTMAARFSDGMVISDGLDAIVAKSGGWIQQVHPDERGTGKMAQALAPIIRKAICPSLGYQRA